MTAMSGMDKNKLLFIVGAVILAAAYLRGMDVLWTVPDLPYRADAAQYYNYAYNLRQHGVYSHVIAYSGGKQVVPEPDALRTPGYPLFLTLFVDGPPHAQIFDTVFAWQALLGTLSVLLTFLLFQRMAPPWVAVTAALLVAISPHLVNTTVYLLSETLFTLLLLAALWVFSLQLRGPRWFLPALFSCGALLGMATLTRPVVELFPLLAALLLCLCYPWRQAAKGAGVLLLGFALLWLPWIARNHLSVGDNGDPTVMVESMAVGLYPDLEYGDDPASRGQPNRFDPRHAEIAKDLGTVWAEFERRMREDTADEIEWYLIGKPLELWSWDLIDGGGDVFMYPVLRSPYSSSVPFIVTHALMRVLHWLLAALALASCLWVWLPAANRYLQAGPLLLARLAASLLLYNTAVLMLLAPFARYSIPFLPLQYGMAALAVYIGWSGLQKLRAGRAVSR
jgi:4-amino-4-deoxy-L-arabinose transferase-like glycosyltransferase